MVGLGKVGELVARLLQSTGLEVTGADVAAASGPLPFNVIKLDVTDDGAVRAVLAAHDAVVSCLPFRFNGAVVEAAAAVGVHYFDLSEDVATTARMMELSGHSRAASCPTAAWPPASSA